MDSHDSIDGDSVDGPPELFIPPRTLDHRSVSVGTENSRCIMPCASLPRSETRYFTQIFILYVVIFTCLGNLTVGRGELNSLWISMLSSCIGLLLPSPYFPRGLKQSVQPNAALQPVSRIP